MKPWILYCLVAAVAAKSLDSNLGNVELLSYDNYMDADGFRYEFQQSDETKVQAQGDLIKVANKGKEVSALVIKGLFSYVIDGVRYTVRYVADQDGYRPTIDQGPSEAAPGYAPISPAVLSSLLGSG